MCAGCFACGVTFSPPERRMAHPVDEAELQLVVAAVDGDRAAFGRLVERFKGGVYAMALAITADPEEAEELAQETFVRALASLPRLEEAGRFPAWLRGITLTLSKDVRRRAARERRHLKSAARERNQLAPAAGAVVAAREARDQAQSALSEAMHALPESTRLALDLRFRVGLSYAEIGELMGVPKSTVRGLLYRGTRSLRQALAPGGRP